MAAPQRYSEQSESHRHLVQFYDDEYVLAKNVVRYLAEGLALGERIVVIATPSHRRAFTVELAELGLDPTELVGNDRLFFFDARETLVQFMVDGHPDPALFDRWVASPIRALRAKEPRQGLRAYGEMVDLLWNAGQSVAAGQLEELWNGMLDTHCFSLLCAYQIDIFGKEFQAGVLDETLRAHSHLVPAEPEGNLYCAVSDAIDEVLGSRAEGLKLRIEESFHPSFWASIPRAESTVLWLRNNVPDYADEILSRARRHYRASLGSGSVL